MASFTFDAAQQTANTAKVTCNRANVTLAGAEQWLRKTITHEDLTAGAVSQTVDLFDLLTIPQPIVVKDVCAFLTQEFGGGGTLSCVVEVGFDDGAAPDTDGFMLSENIFVAAGTGPKGDTAAEKGDDIRADMDSGAGNTRLATPFTRSPTVGAKITATFTVDGAHTVANLSAGSITFMFCVAQPYAL